MKCISRIFIIPPLILDPPIYETTLWDQRCFLMSSSSLVWNSKDILKFSVFCTRSFLISSNEVVILLISFVRSQFSACFQNLSVIVSSGAAFVIVDLIHCNCIRITTLILKSSNSLYVATVFTYYLNPKTKIQWAVFLQELFLEFMNFPIQYN